MRNSIRVLLVLAVTLCVFGIVALPYAGMAQEIADEAGTTEVSAPITDAEEAPAQEGEASTEQAPDENDESTQEAGAQESEAQESGAQEAEAPEVEAQEPETDPVIVPMGVLDTYASRLAAATSPSVMYVSHAQTFGWLDWQFNGATSGSTGQAKRLEAFVIGVKVDGVSGGVTYRSHVQKKGWMEWKNGGELSGTTGEGLRQEAIQIKLTGDLAQIYDIEYRAHVQKIGWQDWVANGATAGTSGRSLRLEAIQIRLVKKDPEPMSAPSDATVGYQAHVQKLGWQDVVKDGATAGTSGRSLRVEALRVHLGSDVDGGITYRAHVQRVGWQDWRSDGVLAGTSGRALRIEALEIKLTGNIASTHHVWYRTHVQRFGWQPWVKDGATAGTTGRSLRVEAVEIKILKDGETPPEDEMKPVSLIYLDAGHGWSGGKYDSGAVGSGYYEATETKELVEKVASYAKSKYGLNVYSNVGCNINYTGRQAHAKSLGATSFVAIHFNASGASASGTESYIYKPYGKYTGAAAPRAGELQKIMHNRLVGALGLPNRGMLTDAFAVTNGKETGIPAVLLEICFITNPNDMRVYKSREDAVAQALAAGLNDLYNAGF